MEEHNLKRLATDPIPGKHQLIIRYEPCFTKNPSPPDQLPIAPRKSRRKGTLTDKDRAFLQMVSCHLAEEGFKGMSDDPAGRYQLVIRHKRVVVD